MIVRYGKKASSLFLILFLSQFDSVLSQDTSLLTLNTFLNVVRQYHPSARQANLKLDSAEAVRLAARGAFDPALFVENGNKTFSGTDYYNYTHAGIEIPTWYGINVKAGIEDNTGDRLINDVTKGKSSYMGVSFPLLKGLSFDYRRASLRQAGILINQSAAEKQLAYNDLLYDASTAYWEWAKTYQVYATVSRIVNISERRFGLVKRSFLGGERAAIDTIEALTQLQSFVLQQQEAWYNWQSARFDLSNYLWLQNETPYQLPLNILPDSGWRMVSVDLFPVPYITSMLDSAVNSHPKLRSLSLKNEILEIDKKLKAQNLLPSLKLNYNFLRKGFEAWKGVNQNLFENNYKYGFDLSMPLFLRQARGELNLANIKLRAIDLQQDLTMLEIENKVRNYYSLVLTLKQQVTVFEQALQNYIQLLNAEEIKFSIGESSLFLLNTRENKVLETSQKLIELRTKFFKNLIALQWAAGTLR